MRGLSTIAVTLLILVAAAPGGCNTVSNRGGAAPTGEFLLDADSNVFVIRAGEPSQIRISGTFDLADAGAVSGTIELDLSAVTISTDDGTNGKGTTRLAAGDVVTITLDLGTADDLDTICDAGVGETIGPFEVTLGEGNVPVSVEPSSINLSDNAVQLLNGGSFSICVTVEAPFDATITVRGFSLSFS